MVSHCSEEPSYILNTKKLMFIHEIVCHKSFPLMNSKLQTGINFILYETGQKLSGFDTFPKIKTEA
jgi:hypothetical protein